MVQKRGKAGYRSFTLVGASKTSGCRTKGYGGRFINRSPRDAAMKAFSDLCRTKKIRGICTLFVTMRCTTKGCRQYGKEYTYKLMRKRLAKPLILLEGTDNEYVIEYRPVAQAVKTPVLSDCGKTGLNRPRSRGRAKKRTAKKTRLTADNVRRMSKRNNNNTNTVRKSKRVASKQQLRRSKRLAAKRM